MNISVYLEAQIANYIRGTNFSAAPVTLTLALSTAAIADDGTGITEPGGNYVRQTITFDAPVTAGSGVSIVSSGAIVFPTATVAYGTVTHAAVFSGTDLLFSGVLAADKLVEIGDTFNVAAGNIQFNLQTAVSVFLANIVQNWIRGTAAPAATTTKVVLSTGDILTDGSGLVEPTGAQGYARQDITFDAPVSVLGTGTSMTNNNPIIFGPVTNTNWPIVTHAGVYQTGGNDLLFYSTLAASRTCLIGDSLPFPIGSVNVLIR